MDKHCRGCLSHHKAGWPPNHKNAKYNDWCCAHGSFASKAIGRCKITGLKRIALQEVK